MKNYFEPMIKRVRAAETFVYDDTVNKNELKRKWKECGKAE